VVRYESFESYAVGHRWASVIRRLAEPLWFTGKCCPRQANGATRPTAPPRLVCCTTYGTQVGARRTEKLVFPVLGLDPDRRTETPGSVPGWLEATNR